MTIIAALPPFILWAASCAAATDSTKGPICAIDIRQQNGSVRIVGVDGHRCFRCLLPLSDTYFAPEGSIRLSPRTFAKAPTKKAVVAEIDDGGMVFFKDKLGHVLSSGSWLPESWASADLTFPNIEQIWPDDTTLSCNPGAFIAMNATYVADFAKVAAKIGSNSVMRLLSADAPIAPLVWQCVLDNEWLGYEETQEVWLQYLLMPVYTRR